jgi:hypothetical protein
MKKLFPLSPLMVAAALSMLPLASHARFDASATAASASAQDDTTDRLIVRYRQTAAVLEALRSL